MSWQVETVQLSTKIVHFADSAGLVKAYKRQFPARMPIEPLEVVWRGNPGEGDDQDGDADSDVAEGDPAEEPLGPDRDDVAVFPPELLRVWDEVAEATRQSHDASSGHSSSSSSSSSSSDTSSDSSSAPSKKSDRARRSASSNREGGDDKFGTASADPGQTAIRGWVWAPLLFPRHIPKPSITFQKQRLFSHTSP